MQVKVTKRPNPKQIVEKTIIIDSAFKEGLDFYELVADKLGWDWEGDALWWLSQNNYIKVEKVKE